MPAGSKYENLVNQRDRSGRVVTVRPNQFLAQGDAGEIARTATGIVRELLNAPNAGKTAPLVTFRDSCAIGGAWTQFDIQTSASVNIPELVARLREQRGVVGRAQPNHVYFVSTRGAASTFSPNQFAPNQFAPNQFAPNQFAPNQFAPNQFAPNQFAPNQFAARWGGHGCCDPCELPDEFEVEIPELQARPVPQPIRRGAERIEGPVVEIHVLDIATPGEPTSFGDKESWIGEYRHPDELPEHEAVNENPDDDVYADPAMAHGDFITSIVRLESGFEARLWRAADPLGAIDDAHLVPALERIAVEPAVCEHRILNLSLAGYNDGDEPDGALHDQIAVMLEANWIIVAAAGNNGDCRPAFPAAIEGVISVGAIGPCGPAWFSNYGWWVDVSAPGVNIVAEYPHIDEITNGLSAERIAAVVEARVGNGVDPTDPAVIKMLTVADFTTGWAVWSGTSFAAPFVAARIAHRLQATAPATPDTGVPKINDVDDAIADAMEYVTERADLPRSPYYGRLVS